MATLITLAIMGIAIGWRAWLIQTESLKLNSDEAVVGLMARHITQGKPIPTFYYGQDYMGSLDALLIAGGFSILGESVTTIRIVQAMLYIATIVTAYGWAYRITRRRRIAWMMCSLLAIPTMLGALYTGITLGGYNELLLFGGLVLWLGWEVTEENQQQLWLWAILGLCAGIGWWTNGAIITPLVVTSLLILKRFSLRHWRGYGVAAICFVIGSLPWWIYNLQHDWAALGFLTNNNSTSTENTLSVAEKFIALVLVGFSSLYGFRFPWESNFQRGIITFLAGGVYLLLITVWIRQGRKTPLRGGGVVQLCFAVLGAVFMFSSFQDATGRYLMPLWIPATLGIALGLERLRQLTPWLAAASLAILLLFQGMTILRAAYHPTGIQAQLDANLIVSDADDQTLIGFLESQGYHYGYTSYWVSYKLSFLTHERLIFDTSLPYDAQGYRLNNNRYEPYQEQVAKAEQIVWITQQLPELDRAIERLFQTAQIEYQTIQIGPYRVYYEFSERVIPSDFGLDDPTFFDR